MQDQEKASARGVADIVFLLDATGSMAPCIDAIKENIGTFIASLTGSDGNNQSPVRDWRSKIVGYRDFNVDAEPWIDQPFAREEEALRTQLAALSADGGGDDPESVLDALYRLANMGETQRDEEEDGSHWRHRRVAHRIVILFTDAPYHPTMAIDEAQGGGFEDVLNACHTNGVVLFIFAPEYDCYNELASIDKAEYEPITGGSSPQEALELFAKDTAQFQKVLQQLGKSVSKSASVQVV